MANNDIIVSQDELQVVEIESNECEGGISLSQTCPLKPDVDAAIDSKIPKRIGANLPQAQSLYNEDKLYLESKENKAQFATLAQLLNFLNIGGSGGSGEVRGISSIEKTSSEGLVDIYTIYFTDNTITTYTVTNGKNGANGKDGVNGKDGENGKDGADGKDGLTPFIGENGNWWIGETDTGVKAAADDSIPVGSGNVTEAEGVNTVTVVAIVIASLALLGNVLLAVLVLKKKKSLV